MKSWVKGGLVGACVAVIYVLYGLLLSELIRLSPELFIGSSYIVMSFLTNIILFLIVGIFVGYVYDFSSKKEK